MKGGRGFSSHVIMIVSMDEGIKARYGRHRSSYIQSVVYFVALVIVTTLAIVSWLINGTGVTLTINLFVIIGKDSFNRTVFVLTRTLGIEDMSIEASTALFVCFSLDASLSSFICMLLAILGVDIGVFGVIHLFLGYIPMALLTLAVLPNRLYMLFRRRDTVKKYKKRMSS